MSRPLRALSLRTLGRRLGLLGGLALVVGLSLFNFRGGPQVAANQAGAGTPPVSPALALVPPHALGFFHQRVADLWNSDAVKDLREKPTRELQDLQKHLEERYGLKLAQLETFTLVLLAPKDLRTEPQAVSLFTTTQPYNRDQILKAMLPTSSEPQQVQGKPLYTAKNSPQALLFYSDRLFLVGQRPALEQLLVEALAVPPRFGGHSAIIRVVDKEDWLVVSLHLAESLAKELKAKPLPPEWSWAAPLLNARFGVVRIKGTDELRVLATIMFGNTDQAIEGMKSIREGLDLLQFLLEPFATQIAKEPELMKLGRFVTQLGKDLKNVRVERQGVTVVAQLPLKSDLATLTGALTEAMITTQRSASRRISTNNLKLIGLAMHNYHGDFGSFPPAAITSKDGKPLLSWRVAILDYLEQRDLKAQFKLDEPWDSPHNLKLLEKMPVVFAPGGMTTREPFTTFYQGFVGPGTVFDPKWKQGTQLGILANADGTSNTFMVVEAGEAVPWTKPADIPYDPSKPVPALGGVFKHGFHALYGDGQVRFVKRETRPEVLHALIQWNDGKFFPDFPK